MEMLKGMVNMARDCGVTPKEMMDYVRQVQKLEVNTAIGTSPNTKVLFVPSSHQLVISALETQNNSVSP